MPAFMLVLFVIQCLVPGVGLFVAPITLPRYHPTCMRRQLKESITSPYNTVNSLLLSQSSTCSHLCHTREQHP